MDEGAAVTRIAELEADVSQLKEQVDLGHMVHLRLIEALTQIADASEEADIVRCAMMALVKNDAGIAYLRTC